MSNLSYWKKQEKKFNRVAKAAVIPSANLTKVDFVNIKKKSDFDRIPDDAGCYWIWTNEEVSHRFHKDETPKGFFNTIEGKKIYGEIIYNGVTEGIQKRIKAHLLADIDATWSGISIDIYFSNVKSHNKKAMTAGRDKVPYINSKEKYKNNVTYIPIRTRESLLRLNLCRKEKDYIKRIKKKIFYFRNGINIFEPKHRKYRFRVYYIYDINSLYVTFIEKKWRQQYGRPILCSYKVGR